MWRNTNTFAQDDNRSFFVDIGFDFWYNGQRYTQLSVSTNGFVDFSSDPDNGDNNPDDFGYDNSAFTNATLAQSTRPALAVLYDDLMSQGSTSPLGSCIRTRLSGSAPNRTFTVEWTNMSGYLTTGTNLNFQVHLVETTGQIIFHYGTMTVGTYTPSYSLGINSATLSNPPLSSQLKMLQVANTNNFSHGIQNNLSVLPQPNTRYIFTPPTPANPVSNLTVTGISSGSMQILWGDWATNEVGYVIYASNDGINYNFIGQTSANSVGANITGLQPSTPYYWRVMAVTEGWLSSASTGTGTTLAAGTKTSLVTGNWNSAATWTPNGVPTATDNVIINNNHTVTINSNAVCNQLTVGNSGIGAVLQIGNNNTAQTFSVFGSINILPGNTLMVNPSSNTTHSITIFGNIVNNGVLNFQPDANSFAYLNLLSSRNYSITGNGNINHYYIIQQNLGSISNSLSVLSNTFSAFNNFLYLFGGTFDYRVPNPTTITPYNVSYSIFPNTAIVMDSPGSVMNFTDNIVINGLFINKRGTTNFGNASNEYCAISGGTFIIQNGTVNCASIMSSNSQNDFLNINVSGGNLNLNLIGSTYTSFAPFNIHAHSSLFNWSNGVITIPNEGGTGTQDLGYNISTTLHPSSSITGGTLQIGAPGYNAGTHTISIFSPNSPIANLFVNNNTRTARPTSSLNILNNVVINSGTLHANSQTLQIGGSWTNNAIFIPSNNSLVHFNSNNPQSIYKNSGNETFHHLQFSGSSVKTFSVPILTNGNFSISTNATVDVNATANHSLEIKGNHINNGTFLARQGLVALTGTANQQVGGSSVTKFWNLTLNNSAGATLTYSQELLGALKLQNGTLNTNSVLTMVSTSTATARIDPINTGADIIGHVTVQRFIPGGSTGWANYGNPISSTLTFNDWDDDLPISCSTCPDGSAAGFTSIWWYNESAAGNFSSAASYVPMSSINDNIVYGRGYWVYVGDGFTSTNDLLLDVKGNVGKFNTNIPLSKTNHGSVADDGWNLIHNPYPAPISWTALRNGNPNVDNAIYVYNADLNGGQGGHASYVNGVSSPAVGSGGIGDNIPMFQGFYVHAVNPTTLTATENIKTATNPTFLKMNNTPSNNNQNKELLRLKLTSSGAFEDETVIYLENGTSITTFDHEFDAYKLPSMNTNHPRFGTETNQNELLSINAIPTIYGNVSIPLKLIVKSSGNFMIQISENTLPPFTCINLYDKFTNTTINLKNQSYSFYMSDTTTVARFLINITAQPLNLQLIKQNPNCTSPTQGTFVANPSGSGPWNFVWKWNGSIVKSVNNKNSSDTLVTSQQGSWDVYVNTVGHCDIGHQTFNLQAVLIPSVQLTFPDSVHIQSQPINFTAIGQNVSSWLWNFGDGLGYSALANPTYSYSQLGTYTVTVNVLSPDNCSYQTQKTIVIHNYDPVGIFDHEISKNKDIRITMDEYNTLYIISKGKKLEKISLYDITGKLLLNEKPNQIDHHKIYFGIFAKGIYLLKVHADGMDHTFKIQNQ
ncbi:MAG: PKD domain-containing protein [Bacteroidia bacterium]|nr:PKD domain-containing protein [Bacteroidia bacterium]